MGGGLFTFDSFDFAFAAASSFPGANASIEGFLSAVSQGIDTYFATGAVVTEVALNLLTAPLDTLVITLNSTFAGPPSFAMMDNVSLNSVEAPEPSTLALFATGLALLGFLGWRRRKAAWVRAA